MNKKTKNKLSLNKKQLLELEKIHRLQIIIEIIFTTFLIAIISVRLALLWPNYLKVFLIVLLLLFVLLLVFGIRFTLRLNHLYKTIPVNKVVLIKNLVMWVRALWVSVAVTFLTIIILIIVRKSLLIMVQAILILILTLWSITTVLIVLVKSQFLWKKFNKKTSKNLVRPIIYSVLGLIIVAVITLTTYTTSETIPYDVITISDGNLELGQNEIRQPGKNGEKVITKNLFFGFTTSISQKDAVDEIKAKGIRRYQYMYCSDGTYRYFEADVFKNPDIGFTHQSPDFCAQNGQGKMTSLADVPPTETQQTLLYSTPQQTSLYSKTRTRCHSSMFSPYDIECYSSNY